MFRFAATAGRIVVRENPLCNRSHGTPGHLPSLPKITAANIAAKLFAQNHAARFLGGKTKTGTKKKTKMKDEKKVVFSKT